MSILFGLKVESYADEILDSPASARLLIFSVARSTNSFR